MAPTSSYKTTVDEEVAAVLADATTNANDNDLWYFIRLSIREQTSAFIRYDHSAADLERGLRNLWYSVIEAAKITSASHPAQDWLVGQILFARELGTITRYTSESSTADAFGRRDGREARVSSGARMWTDLPLLAEELKEVWANSTFSVPTGMSVMTARENLAAFTARLISYGIQEYELSICALEMLKNALETKEAREATDATDATETKEEGKTHQAMEMVSEGSNHRVPNEARYIADLVLACASLIEYCGFKLMRFSLENVNKEFPPAVTACRPGELFRQQLGEQDASFSGFNAARWDFWKKRLTEVEYDLRTYGYIAAAERVAYSHNVMCKWQDQLGW